MKRVSLLLAIALMGLSGWVAPKAQAGDGHHGVFGVWGYQDPSLLYRLGHIPVPPYFALHPPVYYGEQVSRSYGASPFAWRGYQPEVMKPAKPEVTLNPHVVPLPKSKVESLQVDERSAKVMLNPFYFNPQERQVAGN